MVNKNVISVIDGEAGSCGKGKLIGELATDRSVCVGAAVTNCMPNAGHTFVSENGKKLVFRNIPVSAVNPNTELFIGPGSAIDMNVFIKEYESLKDVIGNRKIYVHEMVPLIDERHIRYEKENIKSGSTCKGCGAVLKDKVMRDPHLEFFKGYKNAIRLSNDDWLNELFGYLDKTREYVILEIAQGCDLSLNFSGNYPYVTSRNVSTTQMLADSGIPATSLLGTLMVIRPFPIRISNITQEGDFVYTGDYGNGDELTWSQINIAALMDTYPFKGDIEVTFGDTDDELKRRLFYQSSEISLLQIFGNRYKDSNFLIEDISTLEALEMERLINKSKGIREYQSDVVWLPDKIIDLSEMTTVTKMERRIFELDINKLINNCRVNDPYGLYLNFFQHLSLEHFHAKGKYQSSLFNRNIQEFLDLLETSLNVDLLALGTSAINNERISKKSLILR